MTISFAALIVGQVAFMRMMGVPVYARHRGRCDALVRMALVLRSCTCSAGELGGPQTILAAAGTNASSQLGARRRCVSDRAQSDPDETTPRAGGQASNCAMRSSTDTELLA